MELRPGVRVTSNVELSELLGEGGMGSVWVADHLALGTKVAVKFIGSEDARRNPKDRARFKREAALAARVRSPHAVHIYDYGFLDDEIPFIVMEVLEGETLAERLSRTSLTLRETSLLVSQVAEALFVAHDQGVVHRDIKPANLFLIESGYEICVKVLDFGVAKEVYLSASSELTTDGAVVGTPPYMSPELIVGAPVTPSVDRWALAVTAYRALAGRLPFEAPTVGSLAIKLNQGEFPPPSNFIDDLPASVDDFFAKAFAPDASDRFADVREMAKAFTSAAALDTHMDPNAERRKIIRASASATSFADTVATPPSQHQAELVADTRIVMHRSADTRVTAPTGPSSSSRMGQLGIALAVFAVAAGVWFFASRSTTIAAADPPTPTQSAPDPEATEIPATGRIPTASAASAASAVAQPAPETSTSSAPLPAPPRGNWQGPVSAPKPKPKPKGPCTVYDPVTQKKVFHKVCPN